MNNLQHKKINNLLNCGIVAGPFFILSSVIHALLRPGFDPIRHPASLLSLGEYGWIQISTFILTGILYIAASIGLKQILKSGIGSKLVPPLFIILGLAMIGGGVFTADPSLGFPPGTPMGVPKEISWHSMIHGFAPIIGFSSLLIALIILGRRFGKNGQKGFMWTTIIVSIITWILSSISSFTGNWETGEFNFLPLWAGVILGYSYTSLVLIKLKNES